jgi:eukaryotic-like serine/threonine-protein kinase
MDAQRYKQIKDILIDALDRPAAERGAFLSARCGGDAELRHEVESLLSHESADDFLEPLAKSALTSLSDDPDSEDRSEIDPMIGQRVANYRVLGRLGEGGMGVVYLAEDLRLGRRTALKFLREDLISDRAAKTRLFREARAGAALDHPNICTLYGIEETPTGQTFLAMAYYDGETLKQRLSRGLLPLEQAVDIACQVGSGLAAAHAAGIVHRDVKPGNILLTHERVKILDFGIAKLTNHTALTLPGAVIGTNAYSSPEQAAGTIVDRRTDIWSLGVVVYEMLAGRRPFEAHVNPARALSARLVPPPRLVNLRSELAEELETCVFRALAVDVTARYQSMPELVAALEKVRVRTRAAGVTALTTVPTERNGRPADISTIVVLPYEDGLASESERRLGQAVTEALIDRLSVAARLKVVRCPTPRGHLPFRQHGATVRLRSLRVSDDAAADRRVRIAADINGDVPGQPTADLEREAPASALPCLLVDVARDVFKELGVLLTPDEDQELSGHETVDPSAYTGYLLGRMELEEGTAAACEAAVGRFEAAIAADPPVTAARGALVEACISVVEQCGLPEADRFAIRARRELAIVFETGSWSADVQLAAAEVDYRLEGSLEDAESRLRKVLASRPGSIRARRRLAECLVAAGRTHDAVVVAREAAERDPYSPRTLIRVARVLHFAAEYAESVRLFQAALAIAPREVTARLDLSLTLARQNEPGRACVECDRALASPEGQALLIAALGNAARARGELHTYDAAAGVLRRLAKTTRVPRSASQLLEATFGHSGRPLEYMARQGGCTGLAQFLGLIPVAGSLSSLVDRVGLIAYFGLDESFQSLNQAASYRALGRLLRAEQVRISASGRAGD